MRYASHSSNSSDFPTQTFSFDLELKMPTTLDVYETRRENLSRLLQEPGAKTQLAARLGASQSHITHLLKPPTAASARAIREETARQIEEIMGLAMGQLDQPTREGGVAEIKRSPVRKDPDAMALVEVRNQLVHAAAPDPALLEAAFKLVIDALMEQQVRVPSDKAAKMARLVYEQAQVTGKVDPSLVLTLINLMS